MTGEWAGGFVREPSGALALAEGTEGGWSGGFLRDKEGRLVVSGGGTTAQVQTIAASGAAQTLPKPAEAGIVDLTLTAACTITLPAPVKGASITLFLRQGAGGPWIVTWAGTVKWGYGSAPALTPSAEAIDVVSFVSPDGTAWYGFPGGYEFK